MAIRQWKNNYILRGRSASSLNRTNATDYTNGSKTFFIMRHCAACHNHPSFTDKERQNYKALTTWSICFPNTIQELKSRRKHLLLLFDKWGGISNMKFGSSIVFRAILTNILLFNILQA